MGYDVPGPIDEVFVALAFGDFGHAARQRDECARVWRCIRFVGAIGGGFKDVKVFDEAFAIEAEVTYLGWPNGACGVAHKDTADSGEDGFHALDAGRANVEVVHGRAGLGVDKEVPLPHTLALPSALGYGGGDIGKAVEDIHMVQMLLAGDEPGDAVPWGAAKVALDFRLGWPRRGLDEEAT